MSVSIAGIVDYGEKAEEIAFRDAVEETNCVMSELKKIGEFVTPLGGSSEVTKMFYGWVDSQDVGRVHGLAHEYEIILAKVVPFEETLKDLTMVRVVCAYTAFLLLWLQFNKASLQAQWT